MEREEFIFMPLEEFEWYRGERLVGRYIPGMSYNCTRHPRHDTLYEMCEQWEKEGKIKKTPLAAGSEFKVVEVI